MGRSPVALTLVPLVAMARYGTRGRRDRAALGARALPLAGAFDEGRTIIELGTGRQEPPKSVVPKSVVVPKL